MDDDVYVVIGLEDYGINTFLAVMDDYDMAVDLANHLSKGRKAYNRYQVLEAQINDILYEADGNQFGEHEVVYEIDNR